MKFSETEGESESTIVNGLDSIEREEVPEIEIINHLNETNDAKVEKIPIKRKRGRPTKNIANKNVTSAFKEVTNLNSEERYVLLTSINDDPKSYKEAMSRTDKGEWQKVIDKEIDALVKNQVFEIVDRPEKSKGKQKQTNIIDPRWVFKIK